MHLATSPRAYSRLKREIRDAVAQGKVDGDNNNNNNKPVTYEAAQKLEYLQAVLWEGFRLCVPVNIGHYKVVPEGGDTLAGYYLPPGTAVGHNSLALARNKRVFGADVEAFRPERFLEGDRQQREARVRALEIVFGGGRWTCSGKTVAFFELNKVTFEVSYAPPPPSQFWSWCVAVVTGGGGRWMCVCVCVCFCRCVGTDWVVAHAEI